MKTEHIIELDQIERDVLEFILDCCRGRRHAAGRWDGNAWLLAEQLEDFVSQLGVPERASEIIDRFRSHQVFSNEVDKTDGGREFLWLCIDRPRAEFVFQSARVTGVRVVDGPKVDDPESFYWEGKRYQISKRNWELLRCIWNREAVEFFEVGETVWGDELTSPTTIRSQITRLNKQMEDHGIPLRWGTPSEKVYLIKDHCD